MYDYEDIFFAQDETTEEPIEPEIDEGTEGEEIGGEETPEEGTEGGEAEGETSETGEV